jgi:dTDP-4-amino-4,6-dideoxygalactose transaminase
VDPQHSFEIELSKYLHSDHVHCTNSGLSALYSILKAYNFKKGDEVAIPAYTCENIVKLLHDLKLNIKYIDIEPYSYNMDPNDLTMKISNKTRAVIAVHMFGYPCLLDDIVEISHDYGSIVIEDSAQAMGAEYNGSKTGTFGDVGFFSLGVGKPISTINGGIICTEDELISKNISLNLSKFKSTGYYYDLKTSAYLFAYSLSNNRLFYSLIYKLFRENNSTSTFDITSLTYKYTNYQSLLGLLQLYKLDLFNSIRIENANYLMTQLKSDIINHPKKSKKSNPIYLRLPISINGIGIDGRDKMIQSFKESGIEVTPYMKQSLPQLFNVGSIECPISDKIAKNTVTLPTHPNIQKTDLDLISNIINNWCDNL